ncbi:MAG: DUF2203 family protein [Calditrichaeota bacterium]|nr:MAG: DUF2203 family protein [Calditrichota bacterium]
MKGRFKKYFTVAEANQALPLVRRIVKDILDLSHEMRSLALILGEDAEANPQLQEMLEEMKGFLKELEDVGCFYKDWNFSVGLVDFPAIVDGEEVYLCWRSDEPEIRYYHPIDQGYSARRVLPRVDATSPPPSVRS